MLLADLCLADFFDYACETCGAPYCERVSVMNLALGETEAGYCLPCLAQLQAGTVTAGALAERLKPYILSRDCFKKPWLAFDPSPCPAASTNTCFCQ